MSAPQTDIERQRRRHIVPLIGITVVVLFAVLMITNWVIEEASEAEPQTQEENAGAPASAIPPEVITPAPVVDPATQPAPLAPEPTPQGAAPAETPPAP